MGLKIRSRFIKFLKKVVLRGLFKQNSLMFNPDVWKLGVQLAATSQTDWTSLVFGFSRLKKKTGGFSNNYEHNKKKTAEPVEPCSMIFHTCVDRFLYIQRARKKKDKVFEVGIKCTNLEQTKLLWWFTDGLLFSWVSNISLASG